MSVSLESLMRLPDAAESRGGSMLFELLSFLGIGGTAAAAFIALSTAMIARHTGVPDWLMSVACYAVFIVPVYLLHRRFTFRSDVAHGTALPRYVAVQLTALVLTSIFSFLCYSGLGMNGWPAALLVIALTSGVNFMTLRIWAFAGGRGQ